MNPTITCRRMLQHCLRTTQTNLKRFVASNGTDTAAGAQAHLEPLFAYAYLHQKWMGQEPPSWVSDLSLLRDRLRDYHLAMQQIDTLEHIEMPNIYASLLRSQLHVRLRDAGQALAMVSARSVSCFPKCTASWFSAWTDTCSDWNEYAIKIYNKIIKGIKKGAHSIKKRERITSFFFIIDLLFSENQLKKNAELQSLRLAWHAQESARILFETSSEILKPELLTHAKAAQNPLLRNVCTCESHLLSQVLEIPRYT